MAEQKDVKAFVAEVNETINESERLIASIKANKRSVDDVLAEHGFTRESFAELRKKLIQRGQAHLLPDLSEILRVQSELEAQLQSPVKAERSSPPRLKLRKMI